MDNLIGQWTTGLIHSATRLTTPMSNQDVINKKRLLKLSFSNVNQKIQADLQCKSETENEEFMIAERWNFGHLSHKTTFAIAYWPKFSLLIKKILLLRR